MVEGGNKKQQKQDRKEKRRRGESEITSSHWERDGGCLRNRGGGERQPSIGYL